MSGVMTLSVIGFGWRVVAVGQDRPAPGGRANSGLGLEALAPRMILGWTSSALGGILGRAAGRIGLRRSATRAPVGRLHASRPGPLTRGRVFFFPTGIGRQSAKLRGF